MGRHFDWAPFSNMAAKQKSVPLHPNLLKSETIKSLRTLSKFEPIRTIGLSAKSIFFIFLTFLTAVIASYVDH